ncbi:TetR/AcrR family transcriptional regulator [Actinokineospora sp. HUAS TT18]|uniref:TetR/AcrR family transcriptional regulator n=1 Tax=Actinokineospora sp. HUAS TT18 TaxID=3447451 RepID=UPI003F51FCCF
MPTTTTRKRRPYAARLPIEDRRAQLLDAAMAVIIRDGHDRVSIDAIATEAGVARSVVYGAYENLGTLLTALLDRQQTRAFTQLVRAMSGDRVDLAAGVRRCLDMLRADPSTWRLILLPPEGTPAVVRERVEADKERVRGLFERWISREPARRGGPAVDPEICAHAMLACAEHFARLALRDPDRFDADHLAAQATMIVGALLAGR